MSKRAIDAVFEAMFLLTDIRALLRETAPQHSLDPGQREIVEATLGELQQKIEILRQELLA